jgi:hypothetical protein
MKQMTTKKYNNKQTNKNLIYNYIKYQVNDYNYEQQIIRKENYCPCECCDGFLPIILIDNIPNNLLCYVILKTH